MTIDPPPYTALLDADALSRLRALDPDGSAGLIGRVLGAFATGVERLLPQLQQGRRDGDAQAVRHVAHTLKSSSASVGALRLSQLCAQVETALREGEAVGALDAPLDELVAQAERVLAVLPPRT